MSAGSKIDPLLAKAEPTSNGGSASQTTDLRMEKKTTNLLGERAARREERKYVRETTLQTTKSVKKEREEVLQALEETFPCSPWRIIEQNRIIESLRLEKTSKIIRSNRQLDTTMLAKLCPEVPYLHVF